MEVGSVKWFDNAKGWGFISRHDGSDVFVHYSQVGGDGYRTLRQGQTVRFELRKGPRGQFAEEVALQEDAEAESASAAATVQLAAPA